MRRVTSHARFGSRVRDRIGGRGNTRLTAEFVFWIVGLSKSIRWLLLLKYAYNHWKILRGIDQKDGLDEQNARQVMFDAKRRLNLHKLKLRRDMKFKALKRLKEVGSFNLEWWTMWIACSS